MCQCALEFAHDAVEEFALPTGFWVGQPQGGDEQVGGCDEGGVVVPGDRAPLATDRGRGVAGAPLVPAFGHVQSPIQRRRRRIGGGVHADRDLTVADLAQGARLLAGHACRGIPVLDEPQDSGHGSRIGVRSSVGFDAVAQGQIGAGVDGVGVVEGLAEFVDGGGVAWCR